MIVLKKPPLIAIEPAQDRRPAHVFTKDADFGVVLQADLKRAPGVYVRKRTRDR